MRYVLLFLFLSLLSCQKEGLVHFYPIRSWTKNMEPYLKLRTELRLAFGKTVANALQNENFRKYIHDISQNPTDTIFDEIIFSMHKDDPVEGSKTFAQILNQYTDKEVKSIFGDSLIQKVLANDQCVCLKIPDILYDIPWNPADFAPCVYVETPNNLTGYHDYMYYHCSGYQGLISDLEITEPEHYYIMVKYSEDYTLINTGTWLNEKGIPFLEFLPQTKKNWDVLQPLIQGIAIPSIYGAENVFIPKYNAYKVWSDKYSYKGPLLSQTGGCGEKCLRDCAKQQDFVPTILDHIKIGEPLFYFEIGAIFRESSSLLFGFSIDTKSRKDDFFAIPALRYRKMGFKILSSNFNLRIKVLENVGIEPVPFLSVTNNFQDDTGNPIDIRYVVVPKLNTNWISCAVIACYYNDLVNTFAYDGFYADPIEFHTTYFLDQGSSEVEYCLQPLYKQSTGIVSVYFNY